MVFGGVRASPDDRHAGAGLAVGAHIVGVHAQGVMSLFGWVTGLNDVLTLVAQSNVVWAVGGVVGSSPLSCCEASASCIANAVCRFAIAFQILSGDGPDWIRFHLNSICRSLVFHCTTVLHKCPGCVWVCRNRHSCSNGHQFCLWL